VTFESQSKAAKAFINQSSAHPK